MARPGVPPLDMMARLPERLAAAVGRAPLYRSQIDGSGARVAPLDLRRLLAWGDAQADPFCGRRDPATETTCILQAGDSVPLYLALTPQDVAAAARALAACWRLLGVRRGDHVLIFDYGTSPLTLFASWCYVPGLRRGAADLLGAVPICNDGLPEFAPRAVHVLRYLRPRVAFVDREAMPALVRCAAEQGFDVASCLQLLVVSSDEEIAGAEPTAAWTDALGLPVRWLVRSEAALFFAAQCERGLFHVNPRFYRVEVAGESGRLSGRGEGRLCITSLFLQGSPAVRYLTDLVVRRESGCGCGAPGIALRVMA